MATVNSWIKAARLRTLPLASAGIMMGSGVAVFFQQFNILTFALAWLTAVSLQVLSNFANDYGDFQKGTDNDQRVGPTRSLQSGEITEKEMHRGIIWAALVSLFFGIALLVMSGINWQSLLVFSALGIASILAAYFYTAGNRPYGYVGLGDLSVFLFFGILSVSALYYLYAHEFSVQSLLLAITMGCFSTGVLHLNNMRDRANDLQSGKITIASRLGQPGAKHYHLGLIITGWLSALLFAALHFTSIWQWLFVLSAPFFIKDLIGIFQTKEEAQFDPFLKRLSLSSLLFAGLFLLGVAPMSFS